MNALPSQTSRLRFPSSATRWSNIAVACRLTFVLFTSTLLGVHAKEPANARPLSAYRHLAWTSADDAPTNVTSLAPGPNGELWLVAPTKGLHRFDGVTFTFFPTQVVGMHRLVADGAGGVWGLGSSSVAHIDLHGKSTLFTDANGWPTTIWDLAVVDSRTVWIATGSGLALIRDGQPQALDESWNVPAHAERLLVDKLGRLWVVSGKNSFAHLDKGSRRFVNVESTGLIREDWTTGPDDWIWLTSSKGIQKFRLRDDQSVEIKWISHEPHGSILFDNDGGLWVMGQDSLQHATNGTDLTLENADAALASDAISPKEGFSADMVWSLAEDANHDVWAATSAGLDRFTPTLFHPLKLQARSLSAAIAGASGGETWVAHYDRTLLRTNGQAIEGVPGVGPALLALAVDTRQTLWTGDEEGHLWSVDEKARARQVPIADADRLPIHSLGFDCDGSLLGSVGSDWHLAKLAGSLWVDQGGVNGLPKPLLVRTFRCDAEGTMWFIYKSRLFRRDASGFHEIPRGSIKAPFVLFQRPDGGRMWAGGNGVGYFDGTVFRDLKLANNKTLKGVTGIFETRDGDLWIHGDGQAIVVSAKELAHAYADTGAFVGFERFDATHGLAGSTSWSAPLPTITESADGRLWFVTTAGLAWVDLALLKNMHVAPSIRMVSTIVDDVAYGDGDSPKFPPLSKQLQFAYTATGVANPERLRFRYMIDSIDRKWEEAGTRRTAYYNNLPPGFYRFRVATVQDDGSPGSDEAAFSFEILPAWYQTVGFRTVVGIVVLGLLWLLYLYRIHYLVKRVETRQAVLREERDRLSREIHDTLLQAVYGLVLRFQAVRDATVDEQKRDTMDAALKRADAVIAEGRDRVSDLRQRETGDRLSDALRHACEDITSAKDMQFHVVIVGDERSLYPEAQREVSRIFQQAAANAYQHAEASTVDVQISYDADYLTVRLTDNGVGIPPEILAHGREHHLGLRSMAERAALIGATLVIDRPATGGTSVLLRLPAMQAYAKRTIVASRLTSWLQPAKRLISGSDI